MLDSKGNVHISSVLHSFAAIESNCLMPIAFPLAHDSCGPVPAIHLGCPFVAAESYLILVLCCRRPCHNETLLLLLLLPNSHHLANALEHISKWSSLSSPSIPRLGVLKSMPLFILVSSLSTLMAVYHRVVLSCLPSVLNKHCKTGCSCHWPCLLSLLITHHPTIKSGCCIDLCQESQSQRLRWCAVPTPYAPCGIDWNEGKSGNKNQLELITCKRWLNWACHRCHPSNQMPPRTI